MTTPFTDARSLAAVQYRDATNLDARRALHERFSTNQRRWHPWVFDHLRELPPTSAVLELGCGPGTLWRENIARIPPQWRVTLTDFSAGMVAEARGHLDHRAVAFRFTRADAQALPFANATFDAVIANHMLYHVADRNRAYAEINRILRPGGRLFAATNGHNARLALVDQFAKYTGSTNFAETGFSLETGGAELARWFTAVHIAHYHDALAITEAEPLIAYVLSTTRVQDRVAVEGMEAVRAEITVAIERMLAAQGTIHIPKAVGLFLARRA